MPLASVPSAQRRDPAVRRGEYDIRSLDVFVSRLRKKMGRYNGQNLIETVRGRGYQLNVNISRIG
ncbi:winged helix-turn-helix domain-containing protein [Sphingomonas sp. 22L2VL55-3]